MPNAMIYSERKPSTLNIKHYQIIYVLFTYDGLSTVRTDRDDADTCLEEFLYEGYIVLELLWELVLGCKLGHVSVPALELLINRL